jgi:hypothetical protein
LIFSNLKCLCCVSGLIVVRLHLLAMSGDAGGVLDEGDMLGCVVGFDGGQLHLLAMSADGGA